MMKDRTTPSVDIRFASLVKTLEIFNSLSYAILFYLIFRYYVYRKINIKNMSYPIDLPSNPRVDTN